MSTAMTPAYGGRSLLGLVFRFAVFDRDFASRNHEKRAGLTCLGKVALVEKNFLVTISHQTHDLYGCEGKKQRIEAIQSAVLLCGFGINCLFIVFVIHCYNFEGFL